MNTATRPLLLPRAEIVPNVPTGMIDASCDMVDVRIMSIITVIMKRRSHFSGVQCT